MKQADRKKVADALSVVLANTFSLYLNTHASHWNVTGPHFHDLHKLFEAQYEGLHSAIDELAERIRTLGQPAPAGLSTFAKLSKVKESGHEKDAEAFIKALIKGHEVVQASLEKLIELADDVDDSVTEDLAITRAGDHAKMVWMLESTLA